ncbi:MAG: hypothetical protein DRP57_10565 [Spirochaetes bacterium]|nr:MAG: hypothetical protein DRP57_10565 [Spirochaetota bacterium]
MNSKFFLLVKGIILGTTRFSRGGMKDMFKKGRRWVFLLAVLGTAVGLASVLVMLYFLYEKLYLTGLALRTPQLVIFYAFLISWLMIFVLGIPIILSVLYYSSDTQFLLPLPLKPLVIVSAKTAIVYFYMLILNFIIIAPALFIYTRGGLAFLRSGSGLATGLSIGAGMSSGFGAGLGYGVGLAAAWLSSIIFGPLIPLSIAALFVLLISRVINVSRYKTAFEVAGMLLSLVLILGFQGFLSRAMSGTGGGRFFSQLSDIPDIYGSLAGTIPPVRWFAEGFTDNGRLMLAAVVLISSALIVVTVLLVQLSYTKDFTKRTEAQGKQRARGQRKGQIETKVHLHGNGLILSLLKKEWAILISNSTFIFEAFGETFVFPLIIVIFKYISPNNVISLINLYISRSKASGLLVFGFLALFMGINGVSSTSLSREGKSFYLSLSLPVSGKTQISAKWLFHIILFYPAYLIDVVLVYVLFNIQTVDLIYIIPGGFAYITISFIINIYFDIKRPQLKWTHPQQAMKQNMNVLAGLSFNVITILVFAFLAFLMIRGGMDVLTAGIVILAAISVFAVVLYRVLAVFAERQYLYVLEMD